MQTNRLSFLCSIHLALAVRRPMPRVEAPYNTNEQHRVLTLYSG